LALTLGLSRVVARLGSVVVVFATSVGVLGRTPLYHLLQTVLFTGAFAAAIALARSPDVRAARNLGVWFGALLTVAVGFVLTLPSVISVVLWYGLRGRVSALKIGWALAWPVALGLLAAGLDSWLRFNSPTAVFSALWAVPMKQGFPSGLWSIFFSPGKSVLLYNLPVVLSSFGVRFMLRRGHAHVLALAAIFVFPVLLYLAKNPFWSGGWGWGPRHLLYAVPVLLLPALYFAEELADFVRQRRWRALLLPGMVAVCFVGSGLVVQVLGSALAPENYLRISSAVRAHWLGQPNRSGAFAGTVSTSCTPCFEDDYVTSYLPPFQPIEGHAWLATHLWAGDGHAAAQLTGPWHRETILDFDIKAGYEHARFDWWILDHLGSPRSIGMGLLLFGALLSLAALSGRIWIRNTDSAESPLLS
ncbi:MAG: hypothetical protein SGI86_09285, partial [Deltaproteobacteria bacterium]|nr:hypothetical protein [Deltaproteobacteria bacterium]